MAAAGKPASLAGVVLAGGASPRQGREKAMKPVPDGLRAPTRRWSSTSVSVVGERCRAGVRSRLAGAVAAGTSGTSSARRRARDGLLSAIARGLACSGRGRRRRGRSSAASTQPFLTADLIDALAARAAEVDADIVLPWDGSNHYLAAVYRTELARQVDDLVAAGERNLPALIDRVDSQRVVISDSRPPADAKPATGLRSLLGIGR